MANGVVYIITQDERYVGLLLTSAASLKRVMPDLPITVFSQFPVEGPLFERVIPIEPTEDGFYDKTRLMREVPYDRTLFIDADTYISEPFPELFSLLDRFDCAATHEEYLNTDWFDRYPRNDIPASFPEFNTGVLLLKRSEKLDRVLQEWDFLYRAYLAEKPGQVIGDQPFFRVAVYYSDLRIATLTREYNCKFRGQGYLNGTVKVFHGHVDLKLEAAHIKKAVQALNRSKRPRVYIAGNVFEQQLAGRLVAARKAHKIARFPELPVSIWRLRMKRLKEVIAERGLKGTLARVFATK